MRNSDGANNILYVEDDRDLAEIITQILKECGVVTRVSSKSEALEKLQEQKFSIVLLDLILPDGLGVELLPKLKHMALPVIVFSAHDLPQKYASEVTANLIKSKTSNQKLVETVTQILENNKKNHEKT